MSEQASTPSESALSRRRFLRRLGAAGVAGLAAPLIADAPAGPRAADAFVVTRAARARSSATPLRHIIIACQENRSFDHYFGYYPHAATTGYGVPPGWSVPDRHGGRVRPHHLSSTSTADIAHEWADVHAEWDSGRMNGFYTADGRTALGYYDGADLGYYYALADQFTLCGNYFCGLLGPTYPNRLYLCAGTSGGNTTNTIASGSLEFPMILDLLDACGITFKNYNLGFGAVLGGFDALLLFKRWYRDPRLANGEADFYADLNKGTLPQVSFLTPGVLNAEHPPAPITLGQYEMSRVIDALIHSSAWPRSAFLLTYDEGGGFFEHVAPPVFDAYGAGVRVPTLVVSPYAKPGHLEGTLYEHSSILKFVEAVFNLPTLASINHLFDKATPARNNDAAPPGARFGPPAPPRDGRHDIGDLMECFDFTRNPHHRPRLPAVPSPARAALYPAAPPSQAPQRGRALR